jgi:ABC-type Fe3+ transport system substrate-binding protein
MDGMDRRTLLKGGLYALGGAATLDLIAACGGASGSSTTSASDDVQQAYDSFVKKEMPNVPIDLLKAAKKEGTLNNYMLVPLFNKTLVEAFQKTFPFVQVQLTSLNGGPLVAKFLTESRANQNNADIVMFSSSSDAQAALDEKLILNYKPTVEGEINMDHGVSGYVMPVTGEVEVIAYNSQKLKDSDVQILKKWDGLLDTRWDGKKFAVTEVLSGGVAQLLNYYFNKQYQARMWQRIARSGYSKYPGGNPALDAIISGDIDIGVGIAGSLAVAKLQTGAPLRWTNPQDWLITPYVQFINAKAPHPNAAKLFQEFALSPSGQKIFGDFGGVSLRKGIKSSADFQKQSWYQPVDATKAWSYTDKDLGVAIPDIAKQWRAILK